MLDNQYFVDIFDWYDNLYIILNTVHSNINIICEVYYVYKEK